MKAPTSAKLTQLSDRIARRVGQLDAHHPWHVPCGRTSDVQICSRRICLERRGLLERDAQNSYLAGETVEAYPMDPHLGHSVTYRITICEPRSKWPNITSQLGERPAMEG